MDSKLEVIPATQRSDGTWRKPIRVRRGFNPARFCETFEDGSKSQSGDSEDKGIEHGNSRGSGDPRDSLPHTGVATADDSKSISSTHNNKGTSDGSYATRQIAPSISEDPFASCSNFTDADGLEVFSATVASNFANEDRILIDPVRLFDPGYEIVIITF